MKKLLVLSAFLFGACAVGKDPNRCVSNNVHPFGNLAVSSAKIVILNEHTANDDFFIAEPGVEFLPHLNMAIVTTVDKIVLETISKDERVLGAYPDTISDFSLGFSGQTLAVSASDEIANSWGVDRIKAPALWAKGYQGQGVKVGVFDTGVIKDFPDLLGKIVAGKNFTDQNTDDWTDHLGHGTSVASIIAAEPNGDFMRGVAPRVSLYIAKIVDDNGVGTDSSVVRAFDWALSFGVQAVNISSGSFESSKALDTAVERAFNQGLLIVAAAGNDGQVGCHGSNVESPANNSHVLAVSSTGQDNGFSDFSSHGPEIGVAAPGEQIGEVHSTAKPQTYGTGMGTSYSSPHVAGAAALLLSHTATLRPIDVINLLEKGAVDLGDPGRDDYYGYGLVDVAHSFDLLIQSEAK